MMLVNCRLLIFSLNVLNAFNPMLSSKRHLANTLLDRNLVSKADRDPQNYSLAELKQAVQEHQYLELILCMINEA
jgi:hypothetical protein